MCKVRIGPAAAETLARYHLGQPAVDSGAIDHGRARQTLGIVAGFGPRSASLPNSAAVAVQPAMAESNLTNADEVRGCVAIVRRGGGVPLVVKARRCMDAGARAVLIVNSDDHPLVADAHCSPESDTTDAGDDIRVPVLVVPRSAAALLESVGVGVSLDYDTEPGNEMSVEEYASALQAATRETVPEGIPSPDRLSISHAAQRANESLLGMRQQVQEQWSTDQLREARRRAEAELSELRARLGGGDSSNISIVSTRTGHAGQPGNDWASATGAAAPPMVMQTTVYHPLHTTDAGSAPGIHDLRGTDVDASRALFSADTERRLRDSREKLAAAEQQLFDTKTELASLKGESAALIKERDDERQRVQALQLQLETANASRQVASADLEATREQQKARAAEAIESAARLQRSQANLSAEIARRRSSEAALEEAKALNRELQADKTALNQALLSAQASAVKMEETRAKSDARLEEQLAAAQQVAAMQETARCEAEAALERVRSDMGEQLAAVMAASKAAMQDVERMQKDDEKRLAAALDTIANLESTVERHIETQRQLEEGRDAIAAAAATASEDASVAIKALEKQRSQDSEQGAIQLAASRAETQKYKEMFAETKTKLQAAERANAAHAQREVSLTAELRAARAEANAAMESAKCKAQRQEEASQVALARSKQAHILELEALRRSADDALTTKVASLEADAATRLSAALRESQARHELALREQQGEHELAVRVVRMEVEAETKAALEAQSSLIAQQAASDHQRNIDKLRAEAVALREDAKAQVAELQRVKAEEMQKLKRAATEESELVSRGYMHILSLASRAECYMSAQSVEIGERVVIQERLTAIAV